MIKRFSFIVIVLITNLSIAYSQKTGTTVWGIKGGLNLSGVQTDNEIIVSNDTKQGWQAGIFSKSIVQGWGYIAEAQINTLGSIQQFGDEKQRNTVGYLSIPVALQYRLQKVSFYLGGYAAFRLWAKRKSSKPGVGDFEANIKDNVAFMDYGVFAGINYTYKRFLFDMRYQQGIPNVNTNAQISARVYNASGQLSIGYFLSE